ncbi:UNKNOWN [Stylonychia lemnae]|uniref:Uncharacterized protein n=1 Tax=Stylonychia lemnae TaxID=5949 RepID=A0A077ZQP3_STYLE|nr:UNKNOWN [Stylonychia lemnae]|eukprot:CDW72227.1 UNKNOWN [Stylonychia lemnae]
MDIVSSGDKPLLYAIDSQKLQVNGLNSANLEFENKYGIFAIYQSNQRHLDLKIQGKIIIRDQNTKYRMGGFLYINGQNINADLTGDFQIHNSSVQRGLIAQIMDANQFKLSNSNISSSSQSNLLYSVSQIVEISLLNNSIIQSNKSQIPKQYFDQTKYTISMLDIINEDLYVFESSFVIIGAKNVYSLKNKFINSQFSKMGGHIYLEQTNFFDQNSLFMNGLAYNGGAIYCSQCEMTLNGTNFIENIAVNGGCIYQGKQSQIIMTQIFVNKSAGYGMGGFIASESESQMKSRMLDQDSLYIPKIGSFRNTYTARILEKNDSPSLFIDGLQIFNIFSLQDGGAFYLQSEGLQFHIKNVNQQDSESILGNGGFIYSSHLTMQIIIEDSSKFYDLLGYAIDQKIFFNQGNSIYLLNPLRNVTITNIRVENIVSWKEQIMFEDYLFREDSTFYGSISFNTSLYLEISHSYFNNITTTFSGLMNVQNRYANIIFKNNYISNIKTDFDQIIYIEMAQNLQMENNKVFNITSRVFGSGLLYVNIIQEQAYLNSNYVKCYESPLYPYIELDNLDLRKDEFKDQQYEDNSLYEREPEQYSYYPNQDRSSLQYLPKEYNSILRSLFSFSYVQQLMMNNTIVVDCLINSKTDQMIQLASQVKLFIDSNSNYINSSGGISIYQSFTETIFYLYNNTYLNTSSNKGIIITDRLIRFFMQNCYVRNHTILGNANFGLINLIAIDVSNEVISNSTIRNCSFFDIQTYAGGNLIQINSYLMDFLLLQSIKLVGIYQRGESLGGHILIEKINKGLIVSSLCGYRKSLFRNILGKSKVVLIVNKMQGTQMTLKDTIIDI